MQFACPEPDRRRLGLYRIVQPPMTSPYTQNERVLCYHGPLIYEAKVLDTEHHDNPAPITGKVGWHYFVHYKGWKDKYVYHSVC
jgi:hypothetical protein